MVYKSLVSDDINLSWYGIDGAPLPFLWERSDRSCDPGEGFVSANEYASFADSDPSSGADFRPRHLLPQGEKERSSPKAGALVAAWFALALSGAAAHAQGVVPNQGTPACKATGPEKTDGAARCSWGLEPRKRRSHQGVGFFDDYRKLTRNSHRGLSGRAKLALEFVLGAGACIAIAYVAPAGLANALAVPFFKNLLFAFGWFFVPFGAFVIVGASNAVNLTDGLDGLAIVPSMIAAGCFAVIAYLAGNLVFANYLQIHHVVGAGELTVFCGAMVGASLGFLWFNAPPAMVFMGDTGSLSIGAALGTISVVTKHELVLAIIGGLFVLEAVSVIVQVASYKMTGRRVFRMAPLHHHFEQMGWEEPKIVIRFWIIAWILAIAGLATLKLR